VHVCKDVFVFTFTRYHIISNTHATILRPFFRDHPGELVLVENFWTLWCKGTLTEADTLTNRLGATPSVVRANQCPPPPSPHICYRPDALPAAQPTASSTEGIISIIILYYVKHLAEKSPFKSRLH